MNEVQRPETNDGGGDPRIDVLMRQYHELKIRVEALEQKLMDADAQHQPAGLLSEEKDIIRETKAEKPKRQLGKTIGNAVFYALLVSVVLAAVFIRTASGGAPRSLAGFSGMIVLSESMQSEIPKGSLVITRRTDPAELKIGDDITYMANQTTTVTHRIVSITENYQDTGQRAFKTKGLMNDQPDKLPVPAVNVVGKVVFHSEILGAAAEFVTSYWPVLLLALVVLCVLSNVLRRIYRDESQ